MTHTPDARPISSYIDYRQTIFDIVSDLHSLVQVAEKLNRSDIVKQIGDLRERIEQDSFSIAVVGEFRRGKSTFINALLGQEILPADIMPTSATVNRVRYGMQADVHIIFKGDEPRSQRTQSISIDQLADYVTKLTPEAEALASTIEEAIVYFPVSYCRNNVDIIDTPGLSDDAAMTAVTLGLLPKVDAAIMVIMPEAPFAGSEGDFLTLLLNTGLSKVIFVVTALDRVPREKDRKRVLDLIQSRIHDNIKRYVEKQYDEGTEEYRQLWQQIGEPRIYGLSGYQAVQAKLDKDETSLTQSGFPEFEKDLEKFLTQESGTLILQAHANRLLGFGDQLFAETEVKLAQLPEQAEQIARLGQEVLPLLIALEALSNDMLPVIEMAVQRTRDKLLSLLPQYQKQLIAVAEQRINESPVTASELEGQAKQQLLKYVGQQINQRLVLCCQEWQTIVNRELSEAMNSLRQQLLPLAIAYDHTLNYVLALRAQRDVSMTNNTPERLVGKLGGTVGFVTTWDDTVLVPIAQDRLQMMLQIQQTLTELEDVSFMGGRFVPDTIKVSNFRNNYRKLITNNLERHFQQSYINLYLVEYVNLNIEQLSRIVNQSINTSRQQQTNLRHYQERSNLAIEHKEQSFLDMRTQITTIRNRAQQLVQRLVLKM